jgi:hypothetical protein
MAESDWDDLESLMGLYGERRYAPAMRRAVKAELARRQREEAERLDAERSRRELQQQLAEVAT